jgi:hypothetical protein
MANSASDVQQRGEFWRPPLATRQEAVPALQSECCAGCGTEYVAGSRFCHVCGVARMPRSAVHPVQWATAVLKNLRLRERLALPLGSLIAFGAGILCILAAIGTGLIYTTDTVLDWQAVQVWRIEWLLAAVVALLIGILLQPVGVKRP